MILIAVASVAFLIALVLVFWSLLGTRKLKGQRVVIQTKDDRSLRGVLVGVYRDCLVVGHFEYLDEAAVTDLPGEATVRFDNLSWVHRLGD